MTAYLAPLLLLAVCCMGLKKKQDPYQGLLQGAGDGLKLMVTLAPTLILLMTGVTMLQKSGAMALINCILSPIFNIFGIPPEAGILVLVRPISGSAALATGIQLLRQYGPDSPIGRTVAIMLGSTETTFYAIGVYFGAAKIRNTRYTVVAALMADLTGFIMASLTAKFLY